MPVLVLASSTKIRSKLNVLAWRHDFPNISLWEMFRRSRAPNSEENGPIWLKSWKNVHKIRGKSYFLKHTTSDCLFLPWRFIYIYENKTKYHIKQVTQRATIAHLSPMCQGQSAPKPYAAPLPHNDATHKIWSRLAKVQKCEIFVTQGQVTPKWVVWFSPKSNSTKLSCLSW